jgi:long-chain fatty acid transport protein
MQKFEQKLLYLLFATACLYPQAGLAGGLWINEFGAPAMARAAAGAQTGSDDASAGLYNPAGMSYASGTQWMASGGLIAPKVEFDVDRGSILNGTEDSGNAGSVVPSGSAFYTREIDDEWHFGTNFYALTGNALDYDSDWAGRYQATEVSLFVLAVQPGVSYQVNDRVSVGASLLLAYTELELKVAVPNPTTPLLGPDGRAKIDGDDFNIGYALGAVFELSDSTRLGMVYQSEIDADYEGDGELDPAGIDVGIETELPLAAIFRLGLSHEFDDQLTGHMTLGWDDWSTLDSVNLSTQSNSAVLKRNWDDTYHFAIGASYRIDDSWQWQAGIAYDTSPVDADDRTADLPVDRQVRYAFGVTHTRPDGVEISGSFVYADLGDAEIDALGYGGEYSSNEAIFTSVSFNWPM